MRFCGVFPHIQELTCHENGPKRHRMAGERVRSAFLAVDHADRRVDRQTDFAERALQLLVGQRVERRMSRASGSRRSASGEPFASETIDPSS